MLVIIRLRQTNLNLTILPDEMSSQPPELCYNIKPLKTALDVPSPALTTNKGSGNS